MKVLTEKKLFAGMIVVIATIVAIIIISYQQSKKIHQTALLVSHTNDILYHSATLLATATGIETGARGFALTGDEKFLEPLQKSQGIIYKELSGLKDLTADNPTQQQRLDSITKYVANRIEFSNQVVVARKQGGIAAASELTNTGEGKLYMDKIKELVYQLQTEEEVFLKERKKESELSYTRLNTILLILSISILSLVIILLLAGRKLLLAQGRMQNNLSRFNEQLQEQVHRKTAELTGVFERITDAFIGLDTNWCFTYMNKKAGEILRLDPAIVISKNIWDLLPDSLDQPFYKAYYKAMEEQRYFHIEDYYAPYDKWFENHIYPSSGGLSVFFRDITEKKRMEQQLLQSENRFRALVENNEGIISLLDENLNVLFRSSSAVNITGWTHEEYQRTDATEYIHPDDLVIIKTVMREAAVNPGTAIPVSLRVRHKQGHYIWLEGVVKNMLHDPAIRGVISNMKDISERKETEKKIVKANRMYFFISQVNQMIVRTTDEKTLFKEACRIAVEVGRFRMAWIGIINQETRRVVPVMLAGEAGDYLSKIKIISVDDVPEGRGPTGTAIREGKYMVCNDIETDPKMAPWKEAALGRGYLSSMALPIKKFGTVVGVFSFYASEKNFFDTEEIALLQEATGDVAFALEFFEKEKMRKDAEDEVIKVYKEKEIVLNRINDSVVSLDNEWRYTFLNDAALATHPLGKEETIGKIIWDVHPEMAGTIFWDKYHEAMTTGKVVEVESFYEPMNTWFSVKVYPSPDGLTVFYSNITDRKNAEIIIRNNEEKRRLIMNAALDAIICIDTDGIITFWNPQAETIFGWKEPEVTGKLLSAVIIPEPAAAMHDAGLKRYLKTGHGPALNVLLKTKALHRKGHEFHVELTVLPIKQAGEEFFCAFIRDITEREQIHNEMIKQRSLSDSVINSLPGVFYLYTTEGKFLKWNKNFEVVTKYSTDEIRQMHPLDLFDVSEKALLKETIDNVFINGEASVEAGFLLKTKEKIPYYFTGIALDYEGQKCLLGVGIDISERVLAQERIRQTSEQLRELANHLQKVREEERKRISREIHDELGQQLTAIKMDVAWLDKKLPVKTPIINTKLKNIISLLDGSNVSIRKILTELRMGILDDHDLPGALEWQGRQFTSNTGIPVLFNNPETSVIIPEPVATCIFRAFQEALTNITKYADATRVTCRLAYHEEQIIFEIEDDGKGFDIDLLPGKRSFGILGMKERVASLNGEFQLDSSPGKGTKITITIPCQTLMP